MIDTIMKERRFAKPIKITILLKLLLACFLVGMMASCSSTTGPASKPVSDEENYVYHRVKYSGETYQIISTWYTKSAKNSTLLMELNPRIKPTRIKIGDLIKIPKELLLRPKSLPKEFVDSYTAPKQPKAEPTQQMPVEPAESNYPAVTKSEEPVRAETQVREPAGRQQEARIEEPASPSEQVQEEESVASSQEAEDPNAKIREKLMQELLQ